MSSSDAGVSQVLRQGTPVGVRTWPDVTKPI
jgi:hypothetical protein